MYVDPSKILLLFVMPVGLVLIPVLAAWLLLQRCLKKTLVSLLAAAVVLLWLTSTPFVAGQLGHKLESHCPPLPLAVVPNSSSATTSSSVRRWGVMYVSSWA